MLRRPLRMAPGRSPRMSPLSEQGQGALMSCGKALVKPGDVMEGAPDMLREAQVEATFPDGARPVTAHEPIV